MSENVVIFLKIQGYYYLAILCEDKERLKFTRHPLTSDTLSGSIIRALVIVELVADKTLGTICWHN